MSETTRDATTYWRNQAAFWREQAGARPFGPLPENRLAVGELFAIVREETSDPTHVVVRLYTEDDDAWGPHGGAFDAGWLPELRRIIDAALGALEAR